jgi:soluble cytochrome b562
VADALLELLADHLESTGDRKSATEKMDDILKQLDRNLGQTRDPAERLDLESLKRNLASLKERMPSEEQETVTQEMERLSLLADDIAKKARMKEVEALAKELRNRQKRLLDSLKDLKDSFSREGLEAIMKELKKLEELLRSVMEAMSKMATGLPEEFMNSPELSGLDFQDFFKDLEEIQKKLSEGDLSGAMEAAQRLLQALSEMMAAMGRAGAQAGMGSLDRMQAEMSRQSGELDRILAEQREILTETERLQRELKQKMDEERQRRIDGSRMGLEEILKNLAGSLSKEQKEWLEEMEALYGKGRLEDFSRMLGELEKDLSATPDMKKWMDDLKSLMTELNPDPRQLMTPFQREKFPGLSSREENLKERTSAIQQKLEMLAQLFPGMDTGILNDLKAAAGSMGDASGRLWEEKASEAIPPEQEAIRMLSKSQQAMQQMAQQMAARMQMARWGFPWGYDPRPGWYYGPYGPMPTLPQPQFNRPIEKGFTGIDREEFDPPSKDAYKAPRILREKVLESLKEGVPPRYKREVERYFRGLTE